MCDGLCEVDLVTSDGHEGLKATVGYYPWGDVHQGRRAHGAGNLLLREGRATKSMGGNCGSGCYRATTKVSVLRTFAGAFGLGLYQPELQFSWEFELTTTTKWQEHGERQEGSCRPSGRPREQRFETREGKAAVLLDTPEIRTSPVRGFLSCGEQGCSSGADTLLGPSAPQRARASLRGQSRHALRLGRTQAGAFARALYEGGLMCRQRRGCA